MSLTPHWISPSQHNTPYNPKVIVQDDFMDASYCDFVCDSMGANFFTWFPWYYGQIIPYNSNTDNHCQEICAPEHNHQFSNRLYELNVDTSEYFHLVKPLVDNINPDVLFKVKANLGTQYPKRIVHGYHTDLFVLGCTSVFYLNDNDGATMFKWKDDTTGEERYEEVQSKKGRLVTFDNRTLHSGTTTTDSPYRLVINLNYYKHDYFHENS
tara:strand:+ start:30 stop:662 length:633 start_codon:yes stop_codon:yes gene_type:complete